MGKNTFHHFEKICRKKEFLTIYGQGTRSYTKSFTIITHNNRSGYGRLGITVSKKVGNAVRRNRIKRLIREFFRLNKTQLPESQDIVIIGKKNTPRLNYRDVYKELEGLVSNKANK